MRLAFSNIAWDVAEDAVVAELLRSRGFDAIDIAPGKYFPQPAAATDSEVRAVKRTWADRGFEITGMQALLFGTSGLNVFGERASQQAMLDHLRAVCRVGGVLGATRIVFGAPKNRDRTGLTDEEAMAVASDFFRRVAHLAAAEGVVFCLEPNPIAYGANFMTNTAETAAVVRAVDHPALRMQLDTGALALNDEDAEAVLSAHAGIIGHVHASEPQLLPLGDGNAAHEAAHRALLRHLPQAIVSVEMVATAGEPHLASMARAAAVAVRHYRWQEVAS